MAAGLDMIIGFAVVAVGVILLFFILSIYNGLVLLRNNIDKAWANIDVVLKQRSDIIPNLVETVKGYKKYEQGVLGELTELRASMIGNQSPPQKAKASEAMTSTIKTIFAVAENYPKLKASENFLHLQKQLTGMENQIADRRELYNNSVLLYNTRIKTIPDALFASILGFGAKEYFTANEQEKELVSVNFG